jgi:hypothetical protein
MLLQGPDEVFEKYGVLPHMLCDLQALMGDSAVCTRFNCVYIHVYIYIHRCIFVHIHLKVYIDMIIIDMIINLCTYAYIDKAIQIDVYTCTFI